MASITLSHITKTYAGGSHALSDVSFEIADGEQVVIVGPSGCGKSTLLRLVAGLEEITSGTIKVDGKDITHLAPKDRDVAMVFQDYALYPHLTVRRNLGYALKLRGVPPSERDKRVEAVAAVLGLTALLERRPGMLSGGQKQRVALGRAIVREPLVFLMDEPLSNLDAKLRIQMRGEISRLHDRLRTTTMFVTHDQAEAMTLADRIVVLRDGTIQQIATPDVMYDAPANAFVAGFIGSPTMNFQSAAVERGDRLTLRWRGEALSIAGRDVLGAYAGREVLFGVRPEHVSAIAGTADTTGAIETIENMGNERFLFVRLDGNAATAGSDGTLMVAREAGVDRLQRGQRVALAIDTPHIHFFDPTTEMRIGSGSSPTS